MPKPDPPSRPADRLTASGETLLILALFLVAAGDAAPAVNEQHYLARMRHYWDPSWCPGDFFLESPDAHLTIVLVAGWCTKMLPLPAVAWAGRLLAWTLLAWAWQRLSWAVVARPGFAVLSAGLWLIGMEQGHFSGEWVVGGVEAKSFAYVFVLLALRACLEDRWRAVWVHTGLATALHALAGGWSGLLLLGVWAGAGNERPPLRGMAPSMALGAMLALAGIAPPIAMNWATPATVVAEANQIYVFERLPHHLAPFSKPFDEVAERGARHAVVLSLLALATFAARRQASRDTPVAKASTKRALRLCRFAWGAVLLVVIGASIETLLEDRPALAAGLLRYYWFRLSDVAAPLAVSLAASSAIAMGLERRRPAALAGLCVAVAVIAVPLGRETLDRWRDPTPAADARLADPVAWRDACRWAAESTAPNAKFLVPRNANSFRWWAGRAQGVTWKDIPQDAASIAEWRRRLYDVHRWPAGGGRGGWAPSLGHLGAARLRQLGAASGADYVLTDLRRPASLPIAYRNSAYVVYDLRPAE